MAQWTQETPGAGDMSAVRSFATEQGRRAAELDLAMNGIAAINETVSASITSSAGQAWTARVREFEPKFRSTTQWLRARKDAANAYADAVESIDQRAHGVVSRINGLYYARSQVQSQAIPEGSIQAQVANIDAGIADARADLRALADEREGADQAFTSVLNDALGIDGAASWALAQRLLGDAALKGDYGAYLAARQAVIDEAQTLAGRLSEGDLDADGMTRLTHLMEAFAGDSEMASRFWTGLGGERTREMFWTLNEDIPFDAGETSASLAMAQVARESIAAASQVWSLDQAERFVDQLAGLPDGEMTVVTSLDVTGYLFADPERALMGATFATAMATRLDKVERHPDSVYRGSPVTFLGGVNPLLRQASFGEGPEEVNNGGVYDAMSKVLETLGHHPNQALAWLSADSTDTYTGDATLGEARIDHWFGEREWEYDGWTGAAKLWEGAMAADGGVHSGSTTGEAYRDQAELTAHVIDALGSRGGSDFAPGHLTDAAATSMGTALSGALPWLAETAITAEAIDSGDTAGVDQLQFYRTGDLVTMSVVHGADLSRVWGTVGGNDHGLVVLSEAVSEYQTDALVRASNFEHTGVSWDEAVERFMEIDGFHQGSVGGVEEMQARIADENFAAAVDGIGTLTGLVPVPGMEKLPEAGAWAVEQSVGFIKDAAGDAAVSAWGNEVAAATAESNAALVAGRDVNDQRLEMLWNSGLPGFDEAVGDSQFESWRNDFRLFYTSSYITALESVGREGLAAAYEDVEPPS